MTRTSHDLEVTAHLELQGQAIPIEIADALSYCLLISFHGRPAAAGGPGFDGLRLRCGDNEILLGPCRFEPHVDIPRRRRDDAPLGPGDGRLLFLEQIYDFSTLFRTGAVIDVRHKVEQLPLLWGRKGEIRRSFRDYTSSLVYDMQVYRALFDAIDRSMEGELPQVRDLIHHVAVTAEYPGFQRFYDQMVRELEQEVREFSRQEHEQHGFYFRKQLWDIILASPFLARTNIKPRGYSGDSVGMQMIYERGWRGPTIFSKFMHRYPIETAAAQAVRNRLELVIDRVRVARADRKDGERLRVMSVACGPSRELRDLLREPADAARYQFTLLDQDQTALTESRQEIQRFEREHDARVEISFVQESVRTMLRTPRLSARFGTFHFLYSMGLFDYLTRPVAEAVLSKLYELLVPGGEILLGNFHVGNPTRVYMDYWADWTLFYRTEEEFTALARSLPGARCEISFEETRSQMFLQIRKVA